jgi:hypothetical protein
MHVYAHYYFVPISSYHFSMTIVEVMNGNKMVLLLLEEMDKAMESINSQTHAVCMLMMIKMSMLLINQITVL